MVHPDVAAAGRLQDFDQKIVSLEKEIAALPKQVAEIEKQLAGHVRQLEADKAALAGNQRDRKKLENEVESAKQKMSRLRDQMMSAKTNEQYKAFQNEIVFLEKEIRDWDDKAIELMEAAEPLDAAVKKAEAELKLERQHVDESKAKAVRRMKENETALAEARKGRAECAAAMPPALLSTYEKVKKRWGATVVAEVDGDLCKGCKLMLRPQFMQDLHAGERLMQCENCHRILYVNRAVEAG